MGNKVAMIHQPHFIPWTPYFIRAITSDVLVVLDNVKFHKNYYQNRTMLTDDNGNKFWWTLPICHRDLNKNICEVSVANDILLPKMKNLINMRCKRYSNISNIIEKCFYIIEKKYPSLADINTSLIEYLIDIITNDSCLKKPEIVRSSDIEKIKQYDCRTNHLISLCEDQNCNGIIMGSDSMKCHDLNMINDYNISVFPAQNYLNFFEPSLSILNDLNKYGETGLKEIIIHLINKYNINIRSSMLWKNV